VEEVRVVSGWSPTGAILTFLLAALATSQATAEERPLAGPARAMLRTWGESVFATVDLGFAGSLRDLPDPSCPSETSVRLVFGEVDTGEVPLFCGGWRRLKEAFVYRTPSRADLAVRAVSVARRRLLVQARLAADDSLRDASSLEVQLTIGSTRYCGRMEVADHGPLVVSRQVQVCRDIRPQPNFIVINLDDARYDGVDRMSVVQNVLVREGAFFEHAFTPNPVCAPSRASLLTGLYSINHRTLAVAGDIGGAHRLRESGGDQQTIAVWLSNAGYRTGLFGKYVNVYWDLTEGDKGPGGTFYIPPGWSRWWAMVTPEDYGGIDGEPYEIIEEDGTRTLYDDARTDDQYSTDSSARVLREFVSDAVREGRPFFAYWNPYAPHSDTASGTPKPADRHVGSFAGLTPWRPPSWNEPDVSDKPVWVQAQPMAGAFEAGFTDFIRQRSYESLLSVDEQIRAILDQLSELGVDRDTAIFLTSDNGASWGEHRWFNAKKTCPYEECQRVPLIVRYPRRIRPGTVVEDSAALNVDLAPTIAALAGIEVPVPVDGVTFEAALLGLEDDGRRTEYLMENWRVIRNSVLVAKGPVHDGDRVRLFYGDSLASPRREALFEFEEAGGVTPGAVPVPVAPNNLQATLANLRRAVAAVVPDVLPILQVGALTIADLTPEHHGVIWHVEVDQGGVLSEAAPSFLGGGLTKQVPDFVGLRDLLGGYTWVEYETGERELYDLVEDPFQLENVADDPRYAGIRSDLEQRLARLLDEVSGNALPDPNSVGP